MGKMVKENGLLKSLIFIILLSIPYLFVCAYIVFIFSRSLEGDLAIEDYSNALILLCIFFGVSQKDFFEDGKDGLLQPKHFLLLSALIADAIWIGRDTGMAWGLLVFIGLALFSSKGKNREGFYWKKEVPRKFSKEQVSDVILKNFFVIKTDMNSGSTIMTGYGLWALKIEVELRENDTVFKISPFSTALVLVFALKVLPLNIGEAFGEKILKDIS